MKFVSAGPNKYAAVEYSLHAAWYEIPWIIFFIVFIYMFIIILYYMFLFVLIFLLFLFYLFLLYLFILFI